MGLHLYSLIGTEDQLFDPSTAASHCASPVSFRSRFPTLAITVLTDGMIVIGVPAGVFTARMRINIMVVICMAATAFAASTPTSPLGLGSPDQTPAATLGFLAVIENRR